MINFTKWTALEEHIDVPGDFPYITFSLTPYQDMPNLVDKTERFVDVMGVVTGISAVTILRPKSRRSDSFKRAVQICDGSNSTLNISLWGERATTFQADQLHVAGQEEPQVIIFVGTLVKSYQETGLTLSGGSACKWYIDLDIPQVHDLKKRFKENFQAIKWLDTRTTTIVDDITKEMTVAQILQTNPHKCKHIRFVVNVIVKKICRDTPWWYNSCDACFKTMRPYGSTYRCTGCYKIAIAIPRYKLALIAGDETGDTKFVLFGCTAQHLIRKPAETLLAENPPDKDFIPDEITALLEKSYVWNVSYTEDTIRSNEESLQVNTVISSSDPEQPPLLTSPSGSETSVAMTAASSSSVQSLGKTTIVLPASVSTKAKQLSAPQSSLSTPTKEAVHAAKDKTPTSKLVPIATEVKAKDRPLITSSIDMDKTMLPTSTQKDFATGKEGNTSATVSVPSKTRGQKRPAARSQKTVAKKLFDNATDRLEDKSESSEC